MLLMTIMALKQNLNSESFLVKTLQKLFALLWGGGAEDGA
jgi:hypothetical protein